MKPKYYITTAIAYASSKPHIGNTYEIIMADVLARFKRLEGYDVYFQTGTDEHGQKIGVKALEKGINPQEYVDQISGQIKDIWDIVNISYDAFVRTTDEVHQLRVQKIFNKLYEQGDIYKSVYEGWYCAPCESFWTDKQLVDDKCPDCNREVIREQEEAYFFKMSKYQKQLENYINDHPNFLEPISRKNEMINNFLIQGLQDLCVSRSSFKWGIPITFDSNSVIYVWLDALSNYITFIGYDSESPSEKFNHYWPADLHLIGKDIFRFHSIYWITILMALGLEIPHKIFGHPWLLMNGEKMSKSSGNIIYADDLVAKFGVDAVRYFVIRETPYGADGIISENLIIERFNSDLANNLGNLVNRTIAMAHKYFDGLIENKRTLEDVDKDLIQKATSLKKQVTSKIDEIKVGEALELIFSFLRDCNKYIDETSPWLLAKEDDKKDRLNTVLYNLLESIRISAVLLRPFMPETSQKIFEWLQTNKTSFETVETFGMLETNKLLEPTPLFQRIEVHSDVN